MKLKNALFIYQVIFWVSLIAMFVLQLTMGLGPVMNYYILAPLTFIFTIVTTFCLLPLSNDEINSIGESEGEQEYAEEMAQAFVPPPTQKERIVWIDQLKVLLICLVVIGHSAVTIYGAGAFLSFGLADATSEEEKITASVSPSSNFYYNAVFWSGFLLLKPAIVPLFFFVSGYFSAASRSKYGPSAFLRRSFWRLGTVAILFWLVFNPINAYLGYILVKPENMRYIYSPGQAATWFLTWLLVFNSCYALIDDEELTAPIEKPNFRAIVKIGLLVAFVQAIAGVLCIFSGGAFAEMPCLLVGDGYFNALGYVSGILANTHGWLKNAPDPDNATLVKKSKMYVLAISCLTITICFLCFAPGWPLASIGTHPAGILLVSLVLFLPLGPYCPFIWIVWLDTFQQRQFTLEGSANDVVPENRRTLHMTVKKLLSEAAFVVFLIHYFLLTMYTFLFMKVLEDMQDCTFHFVNSTVTAEIDPPLTDREKFTAFFFVSCLSLISAFLLAMVIKAIPGVGNFL